MSASTNLATNLVADLVADLAFSPAYAPPQSTADKPSVEAIIESAIADLGTGRPARALAAIEGIDRSAPIGDVACTLLGLVSISAGAPQAALAWLDSAIALNPLNLAALNGRAVALAELRRYPLALIAFDRLFRAGGADPAAYYNHGNVLAATGQREAAIEAYDRALQLRPDYPEALRAGGAILAQSGRSQQALAFWDQALRLRPAYLEAILDRANLLDRLERAPEALETLDAGLAHMPGHPQLLNNRGVVLFHLGQLAAALEALDAALATDPSLAPAYLNKAEVKIRQGLFADALVCLDTALSLRPAYVEALYARGIALKLSGRFDAARTCFDAALHLDPANAYARANKGELALLLGDYENGWRDYDFRFLTRGHDRPVLPWPVPEWAGEANPGRVLVFADQAAGDVIHFARYLPVLRASGAAVTLVCRARMQRLLRHAGQGIDVIGAVPEQGAYDYQIPLSNMPLACRTTLTTIPTAPYIVAEDDLVRLWREKLGTHGFKIGLCWRGSQDWRSDPKRSVPLEALRPLAAVPSVRLVSLQMADNLGPDVDTVKAIGIETLDALDTGADGFVETVAVMANLDLIVSCDTSIAHLAGAMGRPTFVLLQQVPEWRFMVEREDSPWYPSMRLFRQVALDDWAHPVERLADAVGRLARSGEAA